MSSISPDELAVWLRETQAYATSADGLHRIGGSVTGLNKALQALGTDSLFWTEPGNLDSLLNRGNQTSGAQDE